jgi:DNA polymerase-3 subunit alpha
MCFQEQAMDVVQQLAGFSAADADNFRKIMSKLYRLPGDAAQRVMQKDHDRFIEGCMTISGMPRRRLRIIWSTKMLPLGNYFFNKSHSIGLWSARNHRCHASSSITRWRSMHHC